ncbi:Methane oxygenase PmoA [Paenibacillus sp. 1_12]|uniref:DUF6807 domain-containing protein n=1 Tax=Paenibacillus sp. 1_12 TaxID=1566278 RepID=UPI0008E77E94|nr:PmoA family protein [Paenibacillus sp. 1_12]SFM38835.1 Methane oxygenase PmoA [Paenibacillus sp. 1_12]
MNDISKDGLRATFSEHKLCFYRSGWEEPMLVQNAEPAKRPFIHPIVAPDGAGVLTEDAPPHHSWQHGLYVGLNDVNGIGFWEEGVRGNPNDGTFHPKPLQPAVLKDNQARWTVETDWKHPSGEVMLVETQAWTLHDLGTAYLLDLKLTLQAKKELTFGRHEYGGLFIRMPYRKESGGNACNSEGLQNAEAEGKRARWVAVSMPIEGRNGMAGVAFMDHPDNPEHPVPWRVDGQLGISPSRCIAGEWKLGQGQSQLFKHRVFVFVGAVDMEQVEGNWKLYIHA